MVQTDCSFLWRMVHNLLPTQERLNRLLSTVTSPECTLCDSGDFCDIPHALITCNFNNDVGNWLIRCLKVQLPNVQPKQLAVLDFGLDVGDPESLPAVWLTAKTLGVIWQSRMIKKPGSILTTRATLEANIMLLRKTRFQDCADTLQNLINTN